MFLSKSIFQTAASSNYQHVVPKTIVGDIKTNKNTVKMLIILLKSYKQNKNELSVHNSSTKSIATSSKKAKIK